MAPVSKERRAVGQRGSGRGKRGQVNAHPTRRRTRRSWLSRPRVVRRSDRADRARTGRGRRAGRRCWLCQRDVKGRRVRRGLAGKDRQASLPGGEEVLELLRLFRRLRREGSGRVWGTVEEVGDVDGRAGQLEKDVCERGGLVSTQRLMRIDASRAHLLLGESVGRSQRCRTRRQGLGKEQGSRTWSG